jgi:NitT/TauT family transport system permease protein
VLLPALAVTLGTTLLALMLALIGAGALAMVLVQSRLLERAFMPFAIILQVTPVVAVAPLLLIYTDSRTAVLTTAFIVAFFPILATMLAGLRAADPGLRDLMRLMGASRLQVLITLELPSALPFALTGLRIGGGLSLIAAVVGEFAAGSAGRDAGLAYRLLEAQYRLNAPRVFAALVLLAVAGIALYGLTSLISHLALTRWRRGGSPR